MVSYGMRVPEAFWAEFASNLFSHPLHRLGSINFPALLQESPVKQFVPLFARNREQEWPLLFGAERATDLAFRVRGMDNLLLWAKFQYPEATLRTSHPE
jgi:hypothetical protein